MTAPAITATAIAILAKAPVPGLAKTRLIPLLGAAGAARAQRRFTLDTLATACHAALGPVTLWCAPDARHRFFRAASRAFDVALRPQPEGDLGRRMRHAFDVHFAAMPQRPLVLVGTDCPALTAAHLRQAAQALQSRDAVLVPAQDGGYVLIGLRRPLPGLFEGIAWSTPQVLAQTRAALAAGGHGWAELPALWDIDEPADWLRLQQWRSAPSNEDR